MPADDRILASDVPDAGRRWFPLATLADLRDGPHPLRLLGRDLVGWLDAEGRPQVTDRRCPHRRADLAGGTIVGDGELQCPYHGWRFDGSGTCASIPQLAGGTVPPGAHISGCATAVRWDMVWVSLDPAADPDADPRGLPLWPEADAGFDVFVDRIEDWTASALRVTENLLDTLHPAFVHLATFGDATNPAVEIDDLVPTEDGFVTTVVERSNAIQSTDRDRRVTLTTLLGPFATHVRALTGPGGTAGPGDFSLLTFAVPVDDEHTRYVRLQALDPGLERDLDALRAFSAAVLAEDRTVVEGLEQDLPLGPGVEVHLRLDRPTIAYRRYLAGLVQGAAVS